MSASVRGIGGIVVNFNTAEHTVRCLASLEGQDLEGGVRKLVEIVGGAPPAIRSS